MKDKDIREDGFYWVTFHSLESSVLGLDEVETRVIAEYLSGSWFVSGSQFEVYSGNEITDIESKKITE